MTSVLPERLDHTRISPMRVVRLPGDGEFTRIETIHVCLLALAEEMRTRYRCRGYEADAHSSETNSPVECEIGVVMVIEDVPELCRRLERLWQQVSTALNQPGSPAVTALAQLHNHGPEVGLHIHTPAPRTPRRRAPALVLERRLPWGRTVR
ncbi:hypothetical protein [Pseudonocardia spinosispora]|uniref:hypothetical protein n=1 Tax=Pseudonocardia spinosispora TaxID=103441 RepID=UPI0012EBEE4C|nr:hypothetical protein [Pseudonocardia spinosispora]